MEVSANIRERYKIQSKKTEADFLLRGLSLLNKADVQYKASRNQRLLVELTLLQLCSLQGNITGAEKKSEVISISPATPSAKGEIPAKQEKIAAEVKEVPVVYTKPVSEPPA